jgi:hypothetical protein
MARKAEQRYRTPAEVAEALGPFARGETSAPGCASQESSPPDQRADTVWGDLPVPGSTEPALSGRLPTPRPGSRWAIWTGGAAAVVLAGLVVVGMMLARPGKPPQPTQAMTTPPTVSRGPAFRPPAEGLILFAPLHGDPKPSIGWLLEARDVRAAPGRNELPRTAVEVRGRPSKLIYSMPGFPRSDYTLLLWVRLSESPRPGKRQIWSGWRAGFDDPLRVMIEGERLSAQIETSGGISRTEGVAFEVCRWTHVGVVKSREKLTLYLDGKPCASGSVPAEVVSTASDFALGDNPHFNGDESLSARFAELRVYSRALPAELIARFAAEEEGHD